MCAHDSRTRGEVTERSRRAKFFPECPAASGARSSALDQSPSLLAYGNFHRIVRLRKQTMVRVLTGRLQLDEHVTGVAPVRHRVGVGILGSREAGPVGLVHRGEDVV